MASEEGNEILDQGNLLLNQGNLLKDQGILLKKLETFCYLYTNFVFVKVSDNKQAGAELGQAQLKLELKLGFTEFKICCIELINKYNTCNFDCQQPLTSNCFLACLLA